MPRADGARRRDHRQPLRSDSEALCYDPLFEWHVRAAALELAYDETAGRARCNVQAAAITIGRDEHPIAGVRIDHVRERRIERDLRDAVHEHRVARILDRR